MLSEQAISSFRQIYRNEFGNEISYNEAVVMASKLLRLFQNIYKPISKEMLENLKKYEI